MIRYAMFVKDEKIYTNSKSKLKIKKERKKLNIVMNKGSLSMINTILNNDKIQCNHSAFDHRQQHLKLFSSF
jgi:hypothetical protein